MAYFPDNISHLILTFKDSVLRV